MNARTYKPHTLEREVRLKLDVFTSMQSLCDKAQERAS